MSRQLRSFLLHFASALGVVALGVAVSGCAAGNVSTLIVAGLIALGSAGLSACSRSYEMTDDAGGRRDAGPDGSNPDGGDGHWETCCISGHVSTCFCPAEHSCNFGWFDICDDGTCADYGACDIDAGFPPPDGGDGTWEPCCLGGEITTCHCPAGAACNFGWFNDCGGGTCVDPHLMCPFDPDGGTYPDSGLGPDAGPRDAGPVPDGGTPPDSGVRDAGPRDAGPVPDGGIPPDSGVRDAGGSGYWEPCCIDGRVTTCFCPDGAICNYGWFTACPDGTCVDAPGEICAP